MIRAALALALLAGPAMAAVPPSPVVGTYLGYEYFVHSTCANQPGVPGSARPIKAIWPGSGQPGFFLYGPQSDATSMKSDIYPTSPAAGMTVWKGTRVHQSVPQGVNVNQYFSAVITYLDGSSFLMRQTADERCGDGSTGKNVSNFAFMFLTN